MQKQKLVHTRDHSPFFLHFRKENIEFHRFMKLLSKSKTQFFTHNIISVILANWMQINLLNEYFVMAGM